MATEPAQTAERASSARTRFLSLVTLVGFVSAVVFVGHETYLAFTDSFVAPIILSPDNELVLQNKMKAGELYAERTKASSLRDSLEQEIAAGENAVTRLGSLLASVSKAPPGGAPSELALWDQRRVLLEMAEQQGALVADAQANLDAGLVTKTDVAKEVHTLSQIRIALLENDRTLLESGLSRTEQGTRIELELLKLQTELRGKSAERAVLGEKLRMLDELEEQLRGRPIFQAMSRSLDVAFIPYTQLEGVAEGGAVYDCLWGLLFCEAVGTVSELVPGEAILTDPWGNQARGQYAVLQLLDHEAAKSKSLRVRTARDAADRGPRDHVASR